MSRSSVRWRSAVADLAGDLGTDQGVGKHRAPRQQAVVLKDEAAVVARPAQRLAVEQDGAGGGGLEPRHHAQKRGLAAAARPDHGDELALLDRDVDAAQRFQLAEPLAQTADLDLARHVSVLGPGHEPLFQPAEAGRHGDAGDGEHDHAGEQLRHVEGVGRLADQPAQARRASRTAPPPRRRSGRGRCRA